MSFNLLFVGHTLRFELKRRCCVVMWDFTDQERVLQKKLHVVSLPSGQRLLTMSQTDSPQKPDQNVTQLEKVVCDYQTNQAPTQDRLNLPFPELVDCLKEFLDLFGLKHTKVTLETSTTPNPCVLLSGPRCHVDEVKQALISALSCLTSDTLVLGGPGAQQYFQAEGKISKDLIQSSCQVLIREHLGVNSNERSCLIPVKNIPAKQTHLQIKFGTLEDQQVCLFYSILLYLSF